VRKNEPRPLLYRTPATKAGGLGERAYPYLMREHSEPRPRDDKDAAQDIARDLAEIVSHVAQLKGDARAYLSDANYNTLKLRLEGAHSAVESAAVEARRRVRLNEGQ